MYNPSLVKFNCFDDLILTDFFNLVTYADQYPKKCFYIIKWSSDIYFIVEKVNEVFYTLRNLTTEKSSVYHSRGFIFFFKFSLEPK
jgi:hypothetical protein